jgi:hypothetical protein
MGGCLRLQLEVIARLEYVRQRLAAITLPPVTLPLLPPSIDDDDDDDDTKNAASADEEDEAEADVGLHKSSDEDDGEEHGARTRMDKDAQRSKGMRAHARRHVPPDDQAAVDAAVRDVVRMLGRLQWRLPDPSHLVVFMRTVLVTGYPH